MTADGPSHVYNAFVQGRVEAGDTLYTQVFAVQPGAPARGVVQPVLKLIGPQLGWLTAERIVGLSVVVMTFFAVWVATGGTGLLSVALAAWLAQSWYLATGFYDFSVAFALFAALVAVVRGTASGLRAGLALVVLTLIYPAHPFVFLVAAALVVWWLGAHVHGGGDARMLGFALPPIAAAAVVLLASTEGGGAAWISPLRQLAGVLVSDWLVSSTPVDLVAGLTVTMLAVGAVAFPNGDDRRPSALALFGVLLVAGSVGLPDAAGGGSYIGIRLRGLGALCLLPAISGWLAAAAPRARHLALSTLVGSLVVHLVMTVAIQRSVTREFQEVDRAARDLGVRAGDALFVTPLDQEYGMFRLSGYAHLFDRLSLDHELVSLQNYEANVGIFPVRWNRRPDGIGITGGSEELVARRIPREWAWRRALVVHECSRPVTAGEGLRLGAAACHGRLGVSEAFSDGG